MITTTVRLAERSYPVHVGRGVIGRLPLLLRRHGLGPRLAVITDSNVAGLYLAGVMKSLRGAGFRASAVVIPPGEREKSFARLKWVIETLAELGLSRSGSALIALGGGVVGDLSALAASVYRRGIPVVQVPTTFLGQIESAIGGKTGINGAGAKNVMGTFHQPAFVLSDVSFHSSLPAREIVSGLGEAVKYAMLDARARKLFREILSGMSRVRTMIRFVAECNKYKAALIRKDERETAKGGGRDVLNLGHAVGHVVESKSNYRLRHGESVVIGLRMELEIAAEAGVIGGNNYKSVADLLELLPRVTLPRTLSAAQWIEVIASGVSHSTFVLPAGSGKVSYRKGLATGILRPAIRRAMELHRLR